MLLHKSWTITGRDSSGILHTLKTRAPDGGAAKTWAESRGLKVYDIVLSRPTLPGSHALDRTSWVGLCFLVLAGSVVLSSVLVGAALGMGNGDHALIAGVVSLIIIWGTVVQAFPIAVAKDRQHPHLLPISIVTVCLGWTLIFWVLALCWSLIKFRD